jgi:predicted nucleotidyltransferase
VDPAAVLFGSTRRRVLALLLGHPDEAYYLRQLVRLTGTAVGAAQRELELLTAARLVKRSVQGRQVYFQANREASIFPELRGLFAKTAGLMDILREGLAPLGDRLRVAFVFGSAARGELSAVSDIDLLVIGEAEFQEVVSAVTGVQERLGRDVNPTVYPPVEFRAKVRARHHFLTNVLNGPRLFVAGGENELVGLAWRRSNEKSRRRRSPARSGRRA